jgi:hypothetical protein
MRIITTTGSGLLPLRKTSVRSPFAWLIVSIHAAWFVLAIANMSPPWPQLGDRIDRGLYSSATLLAGRPFHLEYESLWLKALVLMDLPSWIASVRFGLLLAPLLATMHVGFYRGSYVGASLILIVSSLQWLFFGYLVEPRFQLDRRCAVSRQRLNRIFLVVAAFVLLLTAVAAPLVNARSRRLGFRHAAISLH